MIYKLFEYSKTNHTKEAVLYNAIYFLLDRLTLEYAILSMPCIAWIMKIVELSRTQTASSLAQIVYEKNLNCTYVYARQCWRNSRNRRGRCQDQGSQQFYVEEASTEYRLGCFIVTLFSRMTSGIWESLTTTIMIILIFF